MRPLALAFLACLPLLSACAAPMQTRDPQPPQPKPVACHAEAASAAIGKTPTDAVVEQARRDAGAATARTIRPGQAVTKEFRGDRLNVNVNDRNAIEGLTCG